MPRVGKPHSKIAAGDKCPKNHPYRVLPDKKAVCLWCAPLVYMDKTTCSVGHGAARVKGRLRCYLCQSYRTTPWLKELDENGMAVCTKGHTVTTDTVVWRVRHRVCPQCEVSRKKSVARANALRKSDARCRSGRHRRTDANTRVHNKRRRTCTDCERESKARKNPPSFDFADWVVVHRLVSGQLDEVYAMQRGNLKGPTPREEWIAHCTGIDVRGLKGDTILDVTWALTQMRVRSLGWPQHGEKYGFERMDLYELIGSLAD